MSISIGNLPVGVDHKPFIIAELSGNHNGSLDRVLKMIDIAIECGVDAIKLQTYSADSMTLPLNTPGFHINDDNSLWNGQTLHSLYSKAATPYEWHHKIFHHCASKNILCFSSPFDETAVDLLVSLNAPAYKIASFECIDLPLLKYVCKAKKPIILSTGMATVSEIDEAFSCIKSNGCDEIVLLKCTSNYPADPKNSNLNTIPHMRHLFNCEVGLSDHTPGIGCSLAAIALGATVIEKHFTLSRSDGGVDSAFSLEPSELKSLVIEAQRVSLSLGKVYYGPSRSELEAVKRRRSLYVGVDMKAGDIFTSTNLRRIRPGGGLPPKYYDVILGRPIKYSVEAGTPVTWDMI